MQHGRELSQPSQSLSDLHAPAFVEVGAVRLASHWYVLLFIYTYTCVLCVCVCEFINQSINHRGEGGIRNRFFLRSGILHGSLSLRKVLRSEELFRFFRSFSHASLFWFWFYHLQLLKIHIFYGT